MQYYIYDVRFPYKPYIFQDQDAGTQEPAIFPSEAQALEVCEKMNRFTSPAYYRVACK